MNKTSSVSKASSSSFPELDTEQLESVTGGGTAGSKVLVPTESCPTCLSGTDPKVDLPAFQSLLAGDL